MAASTMGLQWDLPDAVVVVHRIDVETQQLHRTISDVTGVLERVRGEDGLDILAGGTADDHPSTLC